MRDGSPLPPAMMRLRTDDETVSMKTTTATVMISTAPTSGKLRNRSWEEVETIVVELAAAKAGAVEVQLPGIEPGADRLTRRIGPA